MGARSLGSSAVGMFHFFDCKLLISGLAEIADETLLEMLWLLIDYCRVAPVTESKFTSQKGFIV